MKWVRSAQVSKPDDWDSIESLLNGWRTSLTKRHGETPCSPALALLLLHSLSRCSSALAALLIS